MPAHRDDELFNSPPIVTSLCDDDGYDNDEQIACVCVKKTKGTKKKKKEKPFLTEPVCREAGKWWTANRCLCVEPIQIKLARKKKGRKPFSFKSFFTDHISNELVKLNDIKKINIMIISSIYPWLFIHLPLLL